MLQGIINLFGLGKDTALGGIKNLFGLGKDKALKDTKKTDALRMKYLNQSKLIMLLVMLNMKF